jgi:hypothetical protein
LAAALVVRIGNLPYRGLAARNAAADWKSANQQAGSPRYG